MRMVSPCETNQGVREAEVSGHRGGSMGTGPEARQKDWRNLFQAIQGSPLGSSWTSQVRARDPSRAA